MIPTFPEFVTTYVDQDSRAGDVARVVAGDPTWPTEALTWPETRGRLLSLGMPLSHLTSADQLHRSYRHRVKHLAWGNA